MYQFSSRSVINILGGIVVFVLLPPIFFAKNEQWSYGEGVYYSFITLTTIGLGDFVAGFDDGARPAYDIFVSVWILVGLAWMSSLVSNLYDIFSNTMKKVLHQDDDESDPSKQNCDDDNAADPEKPKTDCNSKKACAEISAEKSASNGYEAQNKHEDGCIESERL